MRFTLEFDDFAVAEGRAFCPGASPPDNSCSPANKGTGKPRPPSPDEPDGVLDRQRAAVSGHSDRQRGEYAARLTDWLEKEHGIEMRTTYDGEGPPSMHAMQQVAEGVARLDELGITMPKEIVFLDLPGGAPAGYEYTTGLVMFDPDTSIDTIQDAIENGFLSGTLSSERWGVMVHEMTHHDHREAILDRVFKLENDGLQNERAVIEKIRDLMGRPNSNGPTQDPWDPVHRFSSTATYDDGDADRPVFGQMAQDIAKEVSTYATVNPLEFVAETRTGLAAGITYSDDVMRLYEDYGGPPVPRRRRGD